MTNRRLITAGAVLLAVLIPGSTGSARLIAADQIWSNEDAWTRDALEGRTTASLLATTKYLQDVLLRYPEMAPYGHEDLRDSKAHISWNAQIEQCRVYLDRVRLVLSGRAVRTPGIPALNNAAAVGAVGPAGTTGGASSRVDDRSIRRSSVSTLLAVRLDPRDLDRCSVDGATLADCAVGFLTTNAWAMPLGRAIVVFGPDAAVLGTVFAAASPAGYVATALTQANSADERLRQQKANAERLTPVRMDAIVATFVRQLEEARAPDGQRTAVEQAGERVRALVGRVEQVFADFSRENETTRRASLACKDVDQLPATSAAKAEGQLPLMKPVSATVVASLAEARRLATGCRTPDDGRRALDLHDKARSDYWELDDITRVARSHLLAIPTFYAELKAAQSSRTLAASHFAVLRRFIDEDLAKAIDQAREAVALYRHSLDQHARAVGGVFQESTNLRGAFPPDHDAPTSLTAGFKRLVDAFVAEEADILAESRVSAIDEAITADYERILSLRRIAQARLDDLAACGQMGTGDMPAAIARDVKRIELELGATYRAASQAFSDAKDVPEKAGACGK